VSQQHAERMMPIIDMLEHKCAAHMNDMHACKEECGVICHRVKAEFDSKLKHAEQNHETRCMQLNKRFETDALHGRARFDKEYRRVVDMYEHKLFLLKQHVEYLKTQHE
jgi:hypothetical protein